MRLIERTARWVDPATFELLPVWYPEFSRRSLMYKGNWTQPLINTNSITRVGFHKFEGNGSANKALTSALGLKSTGRANWSCCHIWGIDDPTFQKANAVVQDPRFYSCVANMVLLPTPLEAFTDAMPEVKMMIRVCAWNLYGWHCDHESVADSVATMKNWNDWSDYPSSWPTQSRKVKPMGIIPLNDGIRKEAAKRKNRIEIDLKTAGEHFPRDQVKFTMLYWDDFLRLRSKNDLHD